MADPAGSQITASATATVNVDIVCLWPGHCWRQALDLPSGCTVAQALAAAGWPQVPDRPHIAALGIHGQVVDCDHVLRDGDRIELYRPLQADPKTSRRARASEEQRTGNNNPRPGTA